MTTVTYQLIDTVPTLRRVVLTDLQGKVVDSIKTGWRLGIFTAREREGRSCLVTLMLHPRDAKAEVWETELALGELTFPSMTRVAPQAHTYESIVWDMFGLYPEGHPRLRNVILHEAWPEHFHPLADEETDASTEPRRYEFLQVKGAGVYEIPVGPIHAGIIEPGHFRFSCLGEVIQNLEIRLGYQHRGIERKLTETPWRNAQFVAEAASSDTAVGNALAHALAVEQLTGVSAPINGVQLRAVALEIERLASHIGDLGGICSDIGYAGGAAVFGRLRGRALGVAERLTGSRFMTAYVVPGGVARGLDYGRRQELLAEVEVVNAEFERAVPLVADNAGVLQRMEGIGKARPSLARDFGLVGPAGRASGVDYDVRRDLHPDVYAGLALTVPVYQTGDVLARVMIRIDEARVSLTLMKAFLENLAEGATRASLPDPLPASSVGIGVVEAWRGELIHMAFTDAKGAIDRYVIKDPSVNNWTGLAIAARGELVSDFPLCNKSFGLSYSGHDL